jgi:restriction endonuclease Mrr
MAIPKYDEMMLPLLWMLADGIEHPQRELSDKIADHFKLTAEEQAARLPPRHRDQRPRPLERSRHHFSKLRSEADGRML